MINFRMIDKCCPFENHYGVYSGYVVIPQDLSNILFGVRSKKMYENV